jgi:hypothetical protein
MMSRSFATTFVSLLFVALAVAGTSTITTAEGFVKPPFRKNSAFMNVPFAGSRAVSQNRLIVKFKPGSASAAANAASNEALVRQAISQNAAAASSNSHGNGGVRKVINLPTLGMAVVVLDSFQDMEAAVGAVSSMNEIDLAILDAPVVAYDRLGNLRGGGGVNSVDKKNSVDRFLESHVDNIKL